MRYRFVLNIFCMLFLFLMLLNSSGSLASQYSDFFASERFVFLGWLYNRPLIVTLSFNRGISPSYKHPYIAEFQGHLLFAGNWHHLKNGNYLETAIPFDIDTIPPINHCSLQLSPHWDSGRIVYDYQAVSFNLIFDKMETADIINNPGFFRIARVGEAVMEFQGNRIPGKIINFRKKIDGYNRLAHNFNRYKQRKFERFFLAGQDNEVIIIEKEHEHKHLKDQAAPSHRVVYYHRGESPLVFWENLNIKWLATEREMNPDNPFRDYPVKWEITGASPKGKIEIERAAGFYWFSHGLSGVTGVHNGRLIMGIAEIVRGN